MLYHDIRLKLQTGVLWDLYKQELITKKELDKCIKKITQKERKRNETETGSGVLPG